MPGAIRWMRPCVESLESRELPAGQLAAALAGGVLNVSAASPGATVILNDSPQQITVQGASVSVPTSQVSSIVVSFGGSKVSFSPPHNLSPGSQAVETLTQSGRVESILVNGKTTQQNTFDSQGRLTENVAWTSSLQVQSFYTNGTLSRQNTFSSSGALQQVVIWSGATTQETWYQNGKATQQYTLDASGQLTRSVTWGSIETDSYYSNGKIYQRSSFDTSGHALELITWSSAGAVDTFFKNGQDSLQNTYNTAGSLVKQITWSSTGIVVNDYTNGRLTEQDTFSSDGVHAQSVVWYGNGSRVATYFYASQAYLRQTWDAAGDFKQEAWTAGRYSVRLWNAAGQLLYTYG